MVNIIGSGLGQEILFKTAVFLPTILLVLVEYFTAFAPGFFLEERNDNPSEEEKKKYYLRLLIYTVVSLGASLIAILSKEKTINNYFAAGQLGSVLVMFLISVDTDIKYHVVNRHTLRAAYIVPIIFSILKVSTVLDGVILGAISILIFILFIFATGIGPSDFRTMVVAFYTAYPLQGPISALLILVLGLIISVGYYIYYAKKHKLTRKQIEKTGAPIAPSILVAPLIFLLGHLILVA